MTNVVKVQFTESEIFTSLSHAGKATMWSYIISEAQNNQGLLAHYQTNNTQEFVKQNIIVLPLFIDSYITETVSQYLQKIKTYYTTDQYAALMAALTELYYIPSQTLQLAEWHIYGSSRVGVYKANKPLAVVEDEVITSISYQTRIKYRYNGKKQYELSNHLGNVLVTISDRRTAICNEVDSTLSYEAVVVTATDYYAFGSPMVERTYVGDTTNKYRYGINTQEKDDEIYGKGNATTAEFWEYDTRLGRRWNLDIVVKAWQGDYVCFSNSPIWRIDPNGDDDFFNEDGTFSHRTKEGTRIIVCTADGNKELSQIDVYKVNNAKTVAKISKYYAEKIGVATGTVIRVDKEEAIQKSIANSNRTDGKNRISLSAGFGFLSPFLSDYNNLKSVLYHEKRHLERKHYEIKEKYYLFKHHIAVYEDQINDNKTYEPTTYDFKVAITIKYVSYLTAAYNNGEISFDEIEKKISTFNSKSKDIKIVKGEINQTAGGFQFKVQFKNKGKTKTTENIQAATDPH